MYVLRPARSPVLAVMLVAMFVAGFIIAYLVASGTTPVTPLTPHG